MTPFRIDVPDSVLVDLRERLARTRFPDEFDNAHWEYGTNGGYLRQLCEYWRTGYNWRAHEVELNAVPHFTATIDGRRLHFMHQRSTEAEALPLIITHGWPGSVYEFMKIIGPLTNPTAHGGDARDAFHVVCPSIPGYGWSEAPSRPGFDVEAGGRVNAELMDALGYRRYGVQGGDWGAVISTWNAVHRPDAVCGVHLNMMLGRRPEGTKETEKLSETEQRWLERTRKFSRDETGYQRIQGTKPQTLGYGLNDSPAGLAAWIVEKFRTWSDCDRDVEKRFTKDELLTNIMIYWTTGTITSSVRLYCETARSGNFGPARTRVETPTAFAIFPKELALLPRAWVEPYYNVARWTEMPRGGHFAAMEEPELLVEDMREFFRDLR